MTEPDHYQFDVETLFERWAEELVSDKPDVTLIASIEAIAARDGWSLAEYAEHIITAAGCKPMKKRGKKVRVVVAGAVQSGEIAAHICNPVDESDPLAHVITACGCGCGKCGKHMVMPESRLAEYDEDDEYDYSYEYGEHEEGEHEEGEHEEDSYKLEARQRAQEEMLEDLEGVFGKFDQSTGPEGAHYVEVSPFADEGMVCSNCVFFKGPRGCEVVEGDISPEAICKLWIIPGSLIEEREDYEHEMLDGESLVILSSIVAAPRTLRPSAGNARSGAERAVSRLVKAGKRDWNPDMHPRGRDGRFIIKFGYVTALIKDWDSMDTKMPVDRPRNYRARVVDIIPDKTNPGKPKIRLEVFKSDGTRAGFATVSPDKVTHAAPSKARLDQILNIESKKQQADSLTPSNPLPEIDLDQQEAHRIFRAVAAGEDITPEEVEMATDFFARRDGEDGEGYVQFMEILQRAREDQDYINPEEIIPDEPLPNAVFEERRVAMEDPDNFIEGESEAERFTRLFPDVATKTPSTQPFDPNGNRLKQFRGTNPYNTQGRDDYGREAATYLTDEELDFVIRQREKQIASGDKVGLSPAADLKVLQEERARRDAEPQVTLDDVDFSVLDNAEPYVPSTVIPREQDMDEPGLTSYGMFSDEGNEAVRQALAEIEDDVAEFLEYKPSVGYRDATISKSPTTVKQIIRGFAVAKFKELKQQYPEVSDTAVREVTGDALDSILGKYVEPWQIRNYESWELFPSSANEPRLWGAITVDKWRTKQAERRARGAAFRAERGEEVSPEDAEFALGWFRDQYPDDPDHVAKIEDRLRPYFNEPAATRTDGYNESVGKSVAQGVVDSMNRTLAAQQMTVEPGFAEGLTKDNAYSYSITDAIEASDIVNAELQNVLEARGLEDADEATARAVWEEMFQDAYADLTGVVLDDAAIALAGQNFGFPAEYYRRPRPSVSNSSDDWGT